MLFVKHSIILLKNKNTTWKIDFCQCKKITLSEPGVT